ncbi:MAG: dockerin type I domain-containing protein, partial [Acidobacteriota bacterium]
AIAGQSFTANQAGGACDLNIDGSVNVLDIQSLINAVLGIGTVPPHYDINQDGGVNVLDLQRLANGILGISACP